MGAIRVADRKRKPLSTISRRLILYIVICSSVITLILSVFQLYRDYRADISIVTSQFEEIEKIYLNGIIASLWSMDRDELKTLVEGLAQFGDITYVAITDEAEILVAVGEKLETDTLFRSYPLIFENRGTKLEIGQLEIQVSLTNILDRLYDRAAVILIGNLIKTALVVVFMILIFNYVVNRHLAYITNYLADLDLDVPLKPLELKRKNRASGSKDELDQMVNSINEMSKRTVHAFARIHVAEQRNRNFAVSSSDWFWEMDENLRYTYLSVQFEEISGRKISDVIGTRRWDHPIQEEQSENWDRHKEELEVRKPFKNFEYSLMHKDGKLCFYKVSGVPVFDKQGLFTGYQGSASDVTQQKNLEDQIRRSQKMEAIGQLTSGIAHDFNNILAIIQGNLELLEGAVTDNEFALTRIKKAQLGARRGADITRKLLGFSRKDTEKVSLTSINEFIGNLENLIAKSLTASISVDTALADNLWKISIDTGDFEDAIVNLSLNARDAMPHGGVLFIETANKILDENYVHQNPDGLPGEFVMISVSDTGIGMSKEIKDKVLEPFFTTKDQGKGTGLGLSMVYGFVQRSGGHLKIYSEPGRGTTFRLFLPRAMEISLEDDVAKSQTRPLPKGKGTILIVEDEEGLRDVAVHYLQGLGYETLQAENGQKAFEILENGHAIDLVFSDVVMPGKMDGFQLAMMAHEKNPDLKFLMTSGYTRTRLEFEKDRNKFLIGLNKKLLSKPYSLSELAFALHDTLSDNEDLPS